MLPAALLVGSGKVWTSWPGGQEQVWAVTSQAVPRASEESWFGEHEVRFRGSRARVGIRKEAEVPVWGMWLGVGVVVWAEDIVRVDTGLGATFGRVRVVGEEHGDGWESSAMVLAAVGSSRAHCGVEPLFYSVLTLSGIYNVETENLYIQPTAEKTDVSSW